MSRQLRVQNIADGIPSSIRSPFVVLIDADDSEWRDKLFLRKMVVSLLAKGCRYFVCSGHQSEDIHDQIDDIIVEFAYEGIVTTFHGDDSKNEVAEFLLFCTVGEMNDILVLVRNADDWSTAIGSASNELA